jgi:hypothetical protein
MQGLTMNPEPGSYRDMAGWQSSLPIFQSTQPQVILDALRSYIDDYSPQQDKAWIDSVPVLQIEAGEILSRDSQSQEYSALLEYTLPYDGRRPDVIILAGSVVYVLELKGKKHATQADLDQAAAYARDLRAYHRDCHKRFVIPVLVPMTLRNHESQRGSVKVVSPDRLDELIIGAGLPKSNTSLTLQSFLGDGAYSPLPTLVEAARELFESQTIREIWHAKAATDPAVEKISQIAHEAASSQTRRLVLVTGVPGAGKTLVGMRAIHSKALTDLVVARQSGESVVPGLYLTGNGPLAAVLQYELRKAGGGGSTFVRHIKRYLDRYVTGPERVPPEHVLVFDEAQRAFSADRVADTHKGWPNEWVASEPELFVRICDRMPQWSVLIGLIGGGQEIHLGEEEGLEQWVNAVKSSNDPWIVHGPQSLQGLFIQKNVTYQATDALNLDTEIRFHQATKLHEFIEQLFSNDDPSTMGMAAENSHHLMSSMDGMNLYVTRDLELAKTYLRDRYAKSPNARFGIVASSRDRDLPKFGVENDYMSTKQVKLGPWFADGTRSAKSCCRLESVMTEFGCQGLELEMALLAWGTDLVRSQGRWSIDNAKGYRPTGQSKPRDPYQLRLNAYRVLLTRGRDGTVVFVPPMPKLDETWTHLRELGFVELKDAENEAV